jgi:hypothetical protein
VKAAPVSATAAGAGAGSRAAAGRRLLSAPVAVGKARFVGFSWPAPAAGPPAGAAGGKVWLRARTDAGWSGWREVEPAADGPDANTSEYRRSDRVYSDGQWLDAGTEQVQVRVDPPTSSTTAGGSGTSGTAGAGTPGGPALVRQVRPARALRWGRVGHPRYGRLGPRRWGRVRCFGGDGLGLHGRRRLRRLGWGALRGAGCHRNRPGWAAGWGRGAPDHAGHDGHAGDRGVAGRGGQRGHGAAGDHQPGRVGAVESIRRAAPEYSSTVKAAVIHHTGQTNRYAPSESAALIRADYLYHVRTRGWNDIGYNFLVDRYGRVFEGRYGGVTRAVLGAHAGGFNTYTTGVPCSGPCRPAARRRPCSRRSSGCWPGSWT